MTASLQAPRYFYNCPIKAAFMARYHGMNFIGEEGGDWPLADLLYLAHGFYNEYQSPSDPVQADRFYIDSGSFHLLEPQVGDVVLSMNRHLKVRDVEKPVNGSKAGETEMVRHLYETMDASGCYWPIKLVGFEKVILRNDIPFHTPEREAE